MGHGEKALVKIVEGGGCLVQGYDGWAKLFLAFQFLGSLVNAMKIGVTKFPGEIEMRPYVVENMLQPSRAGVFLGAQFLFTVDVRLLDLHPVFAKAPSEELGPADFVLRRHKIREHGFSVVGVHF